MNPRVADLPPHRVLDLRTLTRRSAERWGSRTALIFDESGERLTFADVEHESDRIAAALQALGVEPGDRVGLMLRNRREWPLCWLGIVKAGAVMVPLNVHYRRADAGFVLRHAGVSALIGAEEFVPLLRETAPQVIEAGRLISVDGEVAGAARDLRTLVRDAPGSPRAVSIGPETLANIQYTSGTTGEPKGCMLSNGWFLRFAWRVTMAHEGLGEDDVMLTSQPFYYVDPQWNVATSLLAGAALVVLDRFHPSSFWARVREHGATWFYCLGVMPKLLLKQPEDPRDGEHRLRLVVCSAIPAADHAALEARWGVRWLEAYGMTESGLDVCVPLDEHDALVGSGCIGRPMPGREVRVVSEDGRPVARGEVGELCLRGLGLMDGYYRNPEATAEAFRDGWLHTGDLVRMDERDLIFFCGRIKDMIRRSGENISAAEVEQTLMQHEAVSLAACVPVPDEVRGEEVKAYVVLQPGSVAGDVPPAELAEFCAARLAYFKVPRYWCYRDSLPRTPSERVIKRELTGQGDPRAGAWDRVDGLWR